LDDPSQPYLPFVFPVFFAALWFAITAFLGFASGWYTLMRRYPDRGERPVLHLRGQLGFMGPLNAKLRGILRLSVCPSGLRVGMFRLFGPFCRDFFVPWEEVSIARTRWLFMGEVATLTFGNPPNGTLGITANVADRLAKAAGDDWPED
jgi:hypothetical protein